MDFPIVPFLTFSIVTIFTPGPNNISSMSFGMHVLHKIINRRGIYLAINIVMARGLFYSAAAILLSDL